MRVNVRYATWFMNVLAAVFLAAGVYAAVAAQYPEAMQLMSTALLCAVVALNGAHLFPLLGQDAKQALKRFDPLGSTSAVALWVAIALFVLSLVLSDVW